MAGHFGEGLDIGDREQLDRRGRRGGARPRGGRRLPGRRRPARGGPRATSTRPAALGITAVPTFVFEGQWAVQGGQESATFLRVLEQVAKETGLRSPPHRGRARGRGVRCRRRVRGAPGGRRPRHRRALTPPGADARSAAGRRPFAGRTGRRPLARHEQRDHRVRPVRQVRSDRPAALRPHDQPERPVAGDADVHRHRRVAAAHHARRPQRRAVAVDREAHGAPQLPRQVVDTGARVVRHATAVEVDGQARRARAR